MSSLGQVHWHEGLFLQPHHLQTMHREVQETMWRQRRLDWAYPYGLIELRVSTDALENMLVRLDRLRAIMPSGLEVDVPGNTDLPALDIKRAFQASSGSFLVGLAVPLWQGQRANTVDAAPGGGAASRAVQEEARVKRLFRVAEITRTDENTGENAQPMMVRRVNARLVTDGDDLSDLEVIPLLRIMHVAEEQTLPRPDPKFVPACLVIGGSPALRNLLRDLGAAVEAARKELVNQMTRGGWVVENIKGPQILQLMRLRTLNRFAATMPVLFAGGVAGSGMISPYEAYLLLRELLGELSALNPARDLFDAPKYDHDNPGPVFFELDARIRPLLRGDDRKAFFQIPLVREGAVLKGAVTEDQFKAANGYWLGVRTKMESGAVASLVEDGARFKLMAPSKINLNIYGVTLKEDRHPPMSLPSASDLHYFRLEPSGGDLVKKRWEEITTEKSVCVRWLESETFEYQDVSLYMTTA